MPFSGKEEEVGGNREAKQKRRNSAVLQRRIQRGSEKTVKLLDF